MAADRASTVAVVVAARPLPAGRLLVHGDLQAARWPAALVPGGAATDPRRLVGRRLAGPMAALEPITARRLLGSGLTDGLGSGIVATSITLETDIGRLVHAGDRVELIAVPRPDPAGSQESSQGSAQRDPPAQTVAAGARVLAVFEPDGAGDSTVAGAGTSLVLAVQRSVAVRVATLQTSHLFTVIADDP